MQCLAIDRRQLVQQRHEADRDVALKVLPDAFTADPDRLARFEREAKVLASLNHPNIGAIYGLEKSGDTRALVLELIRSTDGLALRWRVVCAVQSTRW